MNIKITAKVHADVPLTFAQMTFTMSMARQHYDYYCKMSAEVGGFIYGWWNHFYPHGEKVATDTTTVTMNWNEMDTLFKIIEFNDDIRAVEIRNLLRIVKMHMEEISKDWQKDVEI